MIMLIKKPWFGLALILFVCLTFLSLEIINHRFWLSDFEVYYKAAYGLIYSENLYRHVEDGHYIFKYSPVSAIIFIPFTLFSFGVAKVMYWLVLTGIIVLNFYISVQLLSPKIGLRPEVKQINIIYILSALILALHFLRELHLGQVNYLILFIYVLVLLALIKEKVIISSILLSLSIFIKPFGLIFLPYLLYRKKFKALLMIGISSIVWSFSPLIFYQNWHLFINQYYGWFNEIWIEMGHKQALLADANHTIFSVIARFTPLRFILSDPRFATFYQIALLIALLFFFYKVFKLTAANKVVENTILDFCLLIGFIPLLAFTSENAFIFEQLLVIAVISNFKLLSNFEKTTSVASFIFIGGNLSEILGHQVSAFLNDNSFIAIGTMLLIFVFYKLLVKLNKNQATNNSNHLINQRS
jgi:hypothetical protein